MFHNGKETHFFLKSYPFARKMLYLPTNWKAMKNRISVISCLLALVLLFGSCASSRSSRAMRKAERQMEKMEKESAKKYDRAKTAHYKRQARKTKRMIQRDKRHAERMRRRQRSNPFFSSWYILIRCGIWKITAETAKKLVQLIILQMTENQKYKKRLEKNSMKKTRKKNFFLAYFQIRL